VAIFSQRLGRSLLLSAPSARVLYLLADAAPAALGLKQLRELLQKDCVADTPPDAIISLLDATLPELCRSGLAHPWITDN
jgi:hypothetical protein